LPHWVRRIGGDVVVILTRGAASEPDHDTIPDFLATMPVAHPVLQDAVEKWRPFAFGPLGIITRQLDHRFLHEIERLFAVPDGDFGNAQRAPLHFGEELVELPFALQRLCSR